MQMRSGLVVHCLTFVREQDGYRCILLPACSGLRSKFPVVLAKVICRDSAQTFMVLYLLCDRFGQIVWALFVCRMVPGVFYFASCAKFLVVLKRWSSRISCLLISSRFAIWTAGMNCDRVMIRVQGSSAKLLGRNWPSWSVFPRLLW